MTEPWYRTYYYYPIEVIAEHDLVPTDTIEEVSYDRPWPVQEAVPCDNCRGQGVVVHRYPQHFANPDGSTKPDQFRVMDCDTCHGATEIIFLCEDCGTRKMMALRNGESVVAHEAGCKFQEYCMEHIETREPVGYRQDPPRCRRPVQASFDVHSDGRPVGYCGVHARGKDQQETWAHARKENEDLRTWQQSQAKKKKMTTNETIGAIELALGDCALGPEGQRLISYGLTIDQEKVILKIPIEVLVKFFHLEEEDEPETILSKLEIEVDDGPNPF